MSLCVVGECSRPVYIKSRGLCRAHYNRWWRHGDPLGGRPVMSARTIEDVWARVQRGGADDCWPWTGSVDRDGYGKMKVGALRRAHRIAFYAATGTDPTGYFICHTCDNPPCCNPAHLYRGTALDNNRDIHRRGRWCDRKGARHPLAKLSEADVLAIRRLRAEGVLVRSIAQQFGVASSTISLVVSRSRWSHV